MEHRRQRIGAPDWHRHGWELTDAMTRRHVLAVGCLCAISVAEGNCGVLLGVGV